MGYAHNQKEQSGQSLVELAMSLTLLLILLAGLVDLGRAFFTYITLRDAAQEGASFASVGAKERIGSTGSEFATVAAYCNAIGNRVLVTTTDLSGNTPVSNGPLNLEGLAASGDVTVVTQINGVACTSATAANICMGGAVSVRVNYTSFTLVMPFLGTILGGQTIPLSAVVVDSILTPPCQ
ncbi:MAG TPA: hypothetical protein DEH22_00435 [Chloroflexi bacterium]|nr:hypothetical protein [Chloroflexota bacterium]